MQLVLILSLVTMVHSASLKPKAKEAAQAGFSRACRGPKTIPQMAKSAEVVAEAVVVEVSPPRDNVYAVTLQVIYSALIKGGHNIMSLFQI